MITATYTFMPYFRSQQKLKIHMSNLCLMPCVPSFSNISDILWRPVLMVEEAGVPGENHRPLVSNW